MASISKTLQPSFMTNDGVLPDDVVLRVENLSKKFCRTLKRSMFYGTMDISRSMLGIDYRTDILRPAEFWAVDNVSFELKRGETLGLLGQNGCGKTTVLRLINGIFPPDQGRITVRGRIGALIAVGAGFHPHMTGRENIYLNGTILGMTRREIDQKLDDIIDFAEIGSFIDSPVATYSSGMTIRLGFAIAIHCEPDILLVDEILAVGDAKFQRKCLDKLKEVRKSGVSIILVTHNSQNIEAMSTHALLLDHGQPIMYGKPGEVIPVYELLLQTGKVMLDQETHADSPESLALRCVKKYKGFGTDEVNINSIRLLDARAAPKLIFWSHESLNLEVSYEAFTQLNNIFAWISFIYVKDYESDENNLVCLGARQMVNLEPGQHTLTFHFDQIQLTTGEYKIAFHLFDETFTQPYSQGHYGYFTVKNEVATLLRVGMSTPMCWAHPTME
jgi:lipopolysaccharide transport system ATP-binding protein